MGRELSRFRNVSKIVILRRKDLLNIIYRMTDG